MQGQNHIKYWCSV